MADYARQIREFMVEIKECLGEIRRHLSDDKVRRKIGADDMRGLKQWHADLWPKQDRKMLRLALATEEGHALLDTLQEAQKMRDAMIVGCFQLPSVSGVSHHMRAEGSLFGMILMMVATGKENTSLECEPESAEIATRFIRQYKLITGRMELNALTLLPENAEAAAKNYFRDLEEARSKAGEDKSPPPTSLK